jgi:hypothetical protein
MKNASLGYGPGTDSSEPSLSLSFEWYLRAKNLSDGTVASYLVGVRQFTAFVQPREREPDARAQPSRGSGLDARADWPHGDWCRRFGAGADRPACLVAGCARRGGDGS